MTVLLPPPLRLGVDNPSHRSFGSNARPFDFQWRIKISDAIGQGQGTHDGGRADAERADTDGA